MLISWIVHNKLITITSDGYGILPVPYSLHYKTVFTVRSVFTVNSTRVFISVFKIAVVRNPRTAEWLR